ncbi:hypothetical protein HY968_00990 [Candidatus Kaiserbacteria bacterium]|nr:hypothetical protein [Candidatus Kaiserbacteria bacterium]
MIIVSNHLFNTTDLLFPRNVVVRVNLAWIKDLETAHSVLKKIKHDVYLDYPQGRTRPPKPKLKLSDAINLAKKYKNVKFFAVSNIEDPVMAKKIRDTIPSRIEFVPKIETKRGVMNMLAIIKAARVKHAMLDKEDLYRDVYRDVAAYEKLIAEARMRAAEFNVALLELRGVVFA